MSRISAGLRVFDTALSEAIMTRTLSAVAVMSLLATGFVAQAQDLRARTEVRGTTTNETFTGRLVALDSITIALETIDGTRRSILRRDIIDIEHHTTGARKGRKVLGIAGAVAGAAFYGGLSQAYCTPDQHCERHLPLAIVGGGAVGGAIGAATGALLGSMFTSWHPAQNPRMIATAPRPCIQRPRLEGFLGVRREREGPNGHVSVGFSCGSRVTVGPEVGVVKQGKTQMAEGGVFTRSDYQTRFVGAFGEAVLLRRVIEVSVVGSAGSYRIHEDQTRASAGTLIEQFSRQDNPIGGSAGLKVALPIGSHLAIGVASRAHWLDGSQRITSGITFAVRP